VFGWPTEKYGMPRTSPQPRDPIALAEQPFGGASAPAARGLSARHGDPGGGSPRAVAAMDTDYGSAGLGVRVSAGAPANSTGYDNRP
jgi:hypothetical protein